VSWARLDDRFHENPKIRRLWRACPSALGLWTMALTYCAGNETDGEIDALWLEERSAFAGADDAPAALEAAGLLERVDDETWRIPSFLEFHPSKAEAVEKRAADAARKARGRRAQQTARTGGDDAPPAAEPPAPAPNGTPPVAPPESAERPDGHDPDSARTEDGVRDLSSGPDPTRPDPTVVATATTAPPAPGGGGGAPIPALVPDGIAEPTWTGALDAMVAAGYHPMQIDANRGGLGLAIRELSLPDDVDWWAVGQRILAAREATGPDRLQRDQPASALRFVARGAAGLPRAGDRQAQPGRRRQQRTANAGDTARFPVAAA
jgi:hypothetical protein